MKYMVLIAGSDEWQQMGDTERKALYERVGAWWNEHAERGEILEGHELQGVETATTVRRGVDGNVTVMLPSAARRTVVAVSTPCSSWPSRISPRSACSFHQALTCP